MGYNAGIKYDKNTGQLVGYAEDWQFGLCVQKYANKVNVLTVVSPQKGIELNFPVSHHHVNVLTRYVSFIIETYVCETHVCYYILIIYSVCIFLAYQYTDI